MAVTISGTTGVETPGIVSSGAVSGTTGTFTGNVSGVNGTFTGPVSGTTGTFSDNIQSTSQNGGQLAGLRNRIMNGDMRVAQRGLVPFTVGLAATGVVQYTADRWSFAQVTAATSPTVVGGIISDNAMGGSSKTHIYIQTTATPKANLVTTDYAFIQQNIEGYNVADLKYGTASAKTVTISFRAAAVNFGSTAVISVSLRNSAVDRSYVVPVTITNTAASYSVTIPGDTLVSSTWLTTNGVGLRVGFCAGAGPTYTTSTTGEWQGINFIAAAGTSNFLGTLNAALNITDVQLEVGPVATPFEQRPIGMELALCQRYYEVMPQAGTGSTQASIGTGQNTTTTGGTVPLTFKVTKRATPGVTSSGSLRVYSANGTELPVTSTIFIGVGPEGVSITYGVGSGLIQGYAAVFGRVTNTTGEIQISAEL